MGEIVLGGRYVIENEIGAGGMAIVYKAYDKMLNRSVAIKVLRPEFKQDEEFIKRFDTEAKSAAGLNHPNIVAIYDVGIHEGLRYIVMEHVKGATLKDVIRAKGALPWEQALKFAKQICSALTHAHERKIIHRDIKPHNIMVTEDGSLKVMDFGIARATSASTMTMGSKVLGSAHYLSPEQARGGFTDERSDLYSLGVCLYEMVTGKVPFDAETTVAVAMQHLQKDAPSPREIVPDLPLSVEHIILKAMKKELPQRYLSALSMESDIIRALADPTVIPDSDVNESFYSTRQMDVVEDVNSKNKKAEKKKNTSTVVLLALTAGTIALALAFWAVLSIVSGKNEKNDKKVPQLIGCTVEEAEEIVSKINENITVVVKNEVFSSMEEKGKVVDQEPEAMKNFPVNGYVYIIVGKGLENIELPDFKGSNINEAKATLSDYGLICKPEYTEEDELNEEYEADEVISQDIEAGTVVRVGETIVLTVSKGDEALNPKVPDVVGKDLEEAVEILNENGFMKVSETKEESKEKPGTVIRQEPEGEERLAVEEKIVLVIAEPLKVPDVVGMHRNEAEEKLRETGYENIKVDTEFSKETPGTVIRQEPKKNEQLAFDEEIVIVVAEKCELRFTVPDSYSGAVSVKILNSNNGASVYRNNHMPSEEVAINLNLRENEVGRYEIYINDEFYKEMRVEG